LLSDLRRFDDAVPVRRETASIPPITIPAFEISPIRAPSQRCDRIGESSEFLPDRVERSHGTLLLEE
jgi:hypothetical protein